MKQIERFFLHSTAYTVVITIIFYIFSLFGGYENAEMSFSRFLLILVYGFLISGSEILFVLQTLKPIFRYIIHFSVLFTGFFVIFLSIKNESGNMQFTAATVFAALIIFALLYALIMISVFFIGKIRRTKNGKTVSEQSTANVYKSRFK